MSKSKINNLWFERYYCSSSIPLPRHRDDYSYSDMMYDDTKGVSCVFLPYASNASHTRFVSDVEICMSSDPNITSRFSSEHRDMIKKQLVSQPHSSVADGPRPSDAQLMENGGIVSMERDEIVDAAKHNLNLFTSELSASSSASLSSPAQSSEPTVTEPTSSE